MSVTSKIEWTDATWNPVTGCTEVSPGCDRCYAKTFAERWRGTPGHHFENGFDVQLRPDKLNLPRTWRKPRKVFVNSMSDLFHDSVPDSYIADVFAVMMGTPQHTYQVLTKRHARMRSLLRKWSPITGSPPWTFTGPWPLPNVWLGVSVETQQWADIRIPALLDTPASERFLSCEPLLGPIDLLSVVFGLNGIDWVIVGGESGRGARPMRPDWARGLRDQCVVAGVPFLLKQWGNWAPVGPDAGAGHSVYDYVTDDDRCQLVDGAGRLRGRPWPGWAVQDGTRDGVVMFNYGKGRAGRLLDGRTWDEYPAVANA
jgi:protein gp37